MRNKPRKKAEKMPIVDTKKIKPIEVNSHDDLPERYVLFPDNLELAVYRMSVIEEKLLARGLKVPHPFVIFRITAKENIYERGKHTIKVVRKPVSQLAFRVEKA